MSELKPVDASMVTNFADLPKIRWLGPDKGWRSGVLVRMGLNGDDIAIDLHRQSVVELGEWELDEPKDDAGNPK